MNDLPSTPDERYAAIVEAFRGHPGVSHASDGPYPAKGFGSSALKVRGKIFALLSSQGRFVVKLPRRRVDALIAAGEGERYDPRRDGRLMKGWIALEGMSEERELSLAREAMEFVASQLQS